MRLDLRLEESAIRRALKRAADLAQPCQNVAFRRPVVVGAVLIDEYTGPGVWHGGTGF